MWQIAGPTAAGGPATTRLILQKGFGGNGYICSDMVNHQDKAEKYAKEHGCDIVEPAALRGGYSYFHLDYNGRPHYTGHPHIIRISPKGRSIRRVLDTHELYWAFNQIADLQ